jgi:hypothetical protein
MRLRQRVIDERSNTMWYWKNLGVGRDIVSRSTVEGQLTLAEAIRRLIFLFLIEANKGCGPVRGDSYFFAMNRTSDPYRFSMQLSADDPDQLRQRNRGRTGNRRKICRS